MPKIFFKIAFVIFLFGISVNTQAKLPSIDDQSAASKLREIMEMHASQKEFNAEVIKRTLGLYLDQIDPFKTYFIESDISAWLDPSDALIQKIIQDYKQNSFVEFAKIDKAMVEAILRRRIIDKGIVNAELPKDVRVEEFKDMPWAKNIEELKVRITRLRALQLETFSKLSAVNKEQMSHLVAKRQAKVEEDFLNPDPDFQKRLVLTHLLKAVASALDTHTAYFTPDEARQFMINVQQRLFGIGAQLRDDLNGFTVVKVIDGGPAAEGKELKAKDRIIAVNGEPVVGMDIVDAVDMIRGEKGTPVTLTVIREEIEGDKKDGKKKEYKVDIVIVRGEVVLKETRYDSNFEPFGEGGIAYLRLHSFYQDPESSSAQDLTKAFEEMKKEHSLQGVILDLRSNSGGMLTQAVNVAGLFITKGVIVSIKDENGQIQHLRDIDGTTIWDGPLVVLVNKGSASASEIVAQTLQDYGRAIVIGDEYTYGKGSFQTFTLNPSTTGGVNPQGEYKVTRGRYYTVSGKTPQLLGVQSEIVVPGILSEVEMGEKFTKHPLENDEIKENYDDNLSDIPFTQRARISLFYKYNLQQRIPKDDKLMAKLKANSKYRIDHNKSYQEFLKELKKKGKSEEEVDEEEVKQVFQSDYQLDEAYNILRDLIVLKGLTCPGK
ncbi:MAG: S41 family peptidase [Parachlamydiales bacterium]